jgi:hypothetical protein
MDRLAFHTMRTPRPTTGSAFAMCDVVAETLDMLLARLGLFNGNCPANPLVTRERRKAIPSCAHLHRNQKRPPQISRHSVYNASSESSHSDSVTKL